MVSKSRWEELPVWDNGIRYKNIREVIKCKHCKEPIEYWERANKWIHHGSIFGASEYCHLTVATPANLAK